MKNEPFMRKVLPFLKDEYFTVEEDRVLFKEMRNFILKYNNLPTPDALSIEIDSLRTLKEDQVKLINQVIKELHEDKIDTNTDWLSESTEKFCQEKAIYHAILTSIDIMNNKNSPHSKGAIPQLLSDALAVSFDPNVGHDYLEAFDDRFDYYHRVQEKIPFDLDFFNKITKNVENISSKASEATSNFVDKGGPALKIAGALMSAAGASKKRKTKKTKAE